MRLKRLIVVLGLLVCDCSRSSLLIAGDPSVGGSPPNLASAGRSEMMAQGAAGATDEQTRIDAGSTAPLGEMCNGIDDDHDGRVDEDTVLGQPCDGADSDSCLDDRMSCSGCSLGDDTIEVCNGVDDDCDGIVDDCQGGTCTPALRVAEVVPSRAECFVDALPTGSSGQLLYPCGGGLVTASFGSLFATGRVAGDSADLAVMTTFTWRDGCTWHSTQHIAGRLSSGRLTYSYEETVVDGTGCETPCTAQGTIEVVWNDLPNGSR